MPANCSSLVLEIDRRPKFFWLFMVSSQYLMEAQPSTHDIRVTFHGASAERVPSLHERQWYYYTKKFQAEPWYWKLRYNHGAAQDKLQVHICDSRARADVVAGDLRKRDFRRPGRFVVSSGVMN